MLFPQFRQKKFLMETTKSSPVRSFPVQNEIIFVNRSSTQVTDLVIRVLAGTPFTNMVYPSTEK